ncbi:MAG TPA: ABC transporter substrate-binding protein [Rhodospirillaceae bacterium]|nr:ABC transporter substrate-binding protein [Rhodospirillaceae bacterium]
MADPGEEVRAFIGTMAEQAVHMAADKNISDQARAERFRKLFINSFDISEIGRFVLSRHWKAATAEQQTRFLKLFEDMTVLSWSKRFKDYRGESLKVLDAEQKDGGDWTVISEMSRPQATAPVHLRWKVRQESGGWRVTDIIVESASMAVTQRQDFAAVLQNNGGSIEALLQSLETKVSQLKTGE